MAAKWVFVCSDLINDLSAKGTRCVTQRVCVSVLKSFICFFFSAPFNGLSLTQKHFHARSLAQTQTQQISRLKHNEEVYCLYK